MPNLFHRSRELLRCQNNVRRYFVGVVNVGGEEFNGSAVGELEAYSNSLRYRFVGTIKSRREGDRNLLLSGPIDPSTTHQLNTN